MARNWEHAAGIVWSLLANSARSRKPLNYSDIASAINTNPLSVRLALEPIQSYCISSRLPPLTSIVVGKNSSMPGGGFIAWDVDDLDTAHQAVFSHPWETVTNPYGSFGEQDSISTLSDEILNTQNSAKDVYARVKVRGITQLIFRTALLKAYKGRCAFCGTTFVEALDGAHIKAWGTSGAHERLSVANGLLLCSTHHRMFDAGTITISLSNKIHYRDPGMEGGEYTDADKALSIYLHGKYILLPVDQQHWPGKEFVAAHHSEMKWGYLP